MSIEYRIDAANDILKVKSRGICEDLAELKKYLLGIHDIVMSTGSTRVLVDESQLEYALSTFQTYESGCFVAENAPRTIKIAIVSRSEGWEDSKFWETVVVNRGLNVKIFKDLQSAEKWILKF